MPAQTHLNPSAPAILNIKEILARSTQWLSEKDIETARLDAEVLLAEILEMSRLDLYLAWDRPLDEGEKERYRALLQRRAAHEPVAYILGHKEFFSLDFHVGPGVLVPRPETELLVEEVLAHAKEWGDAPSIVDVGTGSGAIAIALATHLPEATFIATDVSTEALARAFENAQAHAVNPRIDFRNVSLLDGVEAEQDCVVSNPPYIAEGDRASLPTDVVDYEPPEALFAGEDGLDVVRALIPEARSCLRDGGELFLEIGAGQAADVVALLAEDGGFEPARVTPDYQGIDRIVAAQRRI
jgi:release factor glutamine methyltransferase